MSRISSAVSFALGTGILSFAVAANAGIIAEDCTGCSIAQIQSMIPECNPGRASALYVSDFAAGRLYLGCYTIDGVKINAVGNAPMDQVRIKYHWYQPDASIQNTFDAYNSVYQNNGHVPRAQSHAYLHVDLQPKIPSGDDGYLNAYETVVATSNNDRVLQWLDMTKFTMTNTSLESSDRMPQFPALQAEVVALMNAIQTAVISFKFDVRVTVVFHDGSTREYKVDPSGQWTTVPGTARDAHGNPVPESYADIARNGQQEYSFTGDGPHYDQSNFVNSITLYGVPITNGSGGGSSGGSIIGCVKTGDDGSTTCYKIK